MIKILMPDFDLEKTSKSGQCFRMEQMKDMGGGYCLTAYGKYLEMYQEEDGVCLSCSMEEWENIWKNYFDTSTDYERIRQSLDPEDKYLKGALQFGSGIRILRQELFETIICFIISQQNNIPRIKKCVQALCSGFGEQKKNDRGDVYYIFPTPERLAAASLEELSACNLGYRNKYILKTAQMIAKGEVCLKMLEAMPYESARTELMKLCGVGIKVAECICLFSLHHVDAFPIDTHIQSVLDQNYPEGFPFERYRGYAGILQQYAFYYDIYAPKELTADICG